MTEDKTAVIIGAGIGGITTALILAKNGFKVDIYEKNSSPGGCCGQVIRDGHPFDVKLAARSCAIFSYLVHIIRDFRKDQMNNLTYFADEYRQKTIDVLKIIKPLHEPRNQLSLEIIFDLYMMVFERIDIKKGRLTTEELNPTPEETKERVYRKIVSFYK